MHPEVTPPTTQDATPRAGTVALPTLSSGGEALRTSSIPEAVRAAGVTAVYVHVPFCFHKCHYCDFYSFVDRENRQPAFVDALLHEVAVASGSWSKPVETIFIGGGTPTLLEPRELRRLLVGLHESLPLAPAVEWTVEANPETVTPEIAGVLAESGVNRVSVGAQSFDPAHLKTLERWHDPASVRRALEQLRSAGIDNINLDLIFAIPGQSLEEWRCDLGVALELEPSHLSCYGLTYEPNTALTKRLQAGSIRRADDDLEASMYECTADLLDEAGFEHYEISNWARRTSGGSSQRCRHNLLYWTNADWWPFGPSAAGHVDGWRWSNVPRLGDYLATSPWPLIRGLEQLDAETRTAEAFMLGLRLVDGLAEEDADRLLRQHPSGMDERRAAAIERHRTSGLLEVRDGRLRLTRRGRLLADTVLSDLV